MTSSTSISTVAALAVREGSDSSVGCVRAASMPVFAAESVAFRRAARMRWRSSVAREVQ
jgi:hypothetical protein